MKDSGDPLDLLNDDGDGVVESCLFEEEEKGGKSGSQNNRSGCALAFLVLGSALLMGGWYLSRMA